MLRLYLDDSGTDDEAPIVTMGGYFAPAAGWERFEEAAVPILAEEGIAFLHAVDFHHGQGEFATWDGHRKSRFVDRLYTELAAIQARGLTMSAVKKVYNSRRAELSLNQQISAHGFCFGAIINALARKDLEHGVLLKHGCQIFIEGGNQHDGDLARTFRALTKKYDEFSQLFPSLAFIGKRTCVAIQVADFLAYHDRRQMLHAERNGDHATPPPDGPAMAIAKNLVDHGQIIATDFYEKQPPSPTTTI